MLLTSNVNAANGGGSMFTNTITQAFWYINASTGSDSNDGSVGAPLASWRGLLNRWGGNPYLRPAVDGTTGVRLIRVTIQTDLPSTDPISLNATLGQDCEIDIVGTVTATTGTGTFTTVTVKAPATNVPWSFADSAVANAFWADKVGSRIRITSGTNINAIIWVAKDLGTKTFRGSDPSVLRPNVTATGFRSLDVAVKTPAVNDPYAIETMPIVTCGDIVLRGEGTGAAFGYPVLSIRELWFRSGNITNPTFTCPSCIICLHGCKLDGQPRVFICNKLAYNNCHLSSGIYVNEGMLGPAFVIGGLIGGVGLGGVGLSGEGGNIILVRNVLFQSVPILGKNILISSAAVFDSATHGLNVGVGNNIVIPGTVSVETTGLFSGETVQLWGSGNASAGVNVSRCSTFVTTVTPTITGTSGDFQISGQSSSRGYDDSTGLLTAAVTNTWAHLVGTIAAGGHAGRASNFPANAVVVKV